MARRSDKEYFEPAPGIEDLTVSYPFDNDLEIFTLRKDMQATTLPGRFVTWGLQRSNDNPGGTTGFYTTDTKFFALLFAPERVQASGCSAIVELNYTLDQSWPIAFGITPIARKRQFSLIMQNFGIRVIADLYVPEKFAEYNLIGIPDGWGSFATRGHSKNLPMLDVQYQRAYDIAREDMFCLSEDALNAMEVDPRIPHFMVVGYRKHVGEVFNSRTAISEFLQRNLDLPISDEESHRIGDACACGQLNCFLVYGGGEKVRQWVIAKNAASAHPHVWWQPDAMDVVRVNRTRTAINV